MTAAPLLQLVKTHKRFGGRARLFGRRAPMVHAVRGVSLDVHEGETLGVVGESGCGKTTLARLAVGLDSPSDGVVRFDGTDIADGRTTDGEPLATAIQYVFQDPASALNPRKTVRNSLAAPLIYLLKLDRPARERRLQELLDAVNLSSDLLDRFPHELSGGQAQRAGIARALAAEPRLIVLDEPVSALDVSIQAQILSLLDDLRQRFRLTYVFISHDLAVVESVSDRVAVMYFGRVVELAPAGQIFHAPRHPYTGLLIDSAPTWGQRRLAAEPDPSEPPDPLAPPPGCAFAPRCPRADERCITDDPMLEPTPSSDNLVACHHPLTAT